MSGVPRIRTYRAGRGNALEVDSCTRSMVRFTATPAGPTWGPAYEHAKDSYERTTKETGTYPRGHYHQPRGRRSLSVRYSSPPRCVHARRADACSW